MQVNKMNNVSRKMVPILLACVFFSAFNISVIADDGYWGLWKTVAKSKPVVEVTIKRKKRTTVKIDGKVVNMEYQWTSGKHGHGLIEFLNEDVKSDGRETHVGLYLIGGTLKDKAVLTGYYYYIQYDAEGRAVKDIAEPVALYLLEGYGWKD